MVEGTRLSKIESELARMEIELREAKEQRQSFQESINTQFAQMRELIEKQLSSKHDSETTPPQTPLRSPKNDAASNSSSSSRISLREYKHDIPPLSGEDVDDWIFRIEEYFDIAGTPMDQRIKLASFYMVGPA